MKRMLCLLLSVVLLLPIFGCAKEEPEETFYPYTEYPEPVFTPGTLESDLLTVQNGNYDRSNRTGGTTFLEIGSGYYFILNRLYYADKADMSNWVPVCPDPDCSHISDICPANITHAFLAGDRLHYMKIDRETFSIFFPKVENASGAVLCSRALDGSDLQLAHFCESSLMLSGGALSYCLFPDGYALGLCRFNSDGTYTAELYIYDSVNGEKKLAQIDHLDGYSSIMCVWSAYERHLMLGDNAFITEMLAGEAYENYICWMSDDEAEVVDISGMWVYGSYLSGNTLRCFNPGDGYYDIDLLTGEEIKLADAQLENSNARILLPNCIIESTLLYNNQDPDLKEKRAQVETHAMRFFNGQQWHDVTLPEELQNAPDSQYVHVQAVTTDCVMFFTNANGEFHLYRMALDAEEYKLEPCGTFSVS